MTKFEQIGVEYQNLAVTKGEAIRNFHRSCYTCCVRGVGAHIDCDKCAIAATHVATIAAFECVPPKVIHK